MDVFSNILYILLGVVSFALVGFFAWATWNGGRGDKDTGWDDAPEQPNPPPAPPTETTAPPAEPAASTAGRV